MALAYKLRNRATGETFDFKVGLFNANETIEGSDSQKEYDGFTFYQSNRWKATGTPTFYSRGNTLEEINKDINYWLSNTFEFVNHPNYTLTFTSTMLQNYSNFNWVWKDTDTNLRVNVKASMQLLRGSINYKGREVGRFFAGDGYPFYYSYSMEPTGDDSIEGVPVCSNKSLFTNNLYAPSPTILFDSESGTFCCETINKATFRGVYNATITTAPANALVAIGDKKLPLNFMQSQTVGRTKVLQGKEVSATFEYSVTTQGGTKTNMYGQSYDTLYTLTDQQLYRSTAQWAGDNDESALQYVPTTFLLYYLLSDRTIDNPPYDPDKPPTEPSDPNDPPTGGGGSEDDSSDDISEPLLPTVDITASGIVKLYLLSTAELNSFSQYLWDSDWFNIIAKLFDDPMQSIISLMGFNLYIPTSGTDTIIIGNVDTKQSASVIRNSKIKIDFGTIHIDKYYNDYSDFNATDIEIYMPFIGYRALDIYEVMDADITLSYYIDLLTGSFVAMIKINRNRFGTDLNAILYQVEGNMASQYPLSSQDKTALMQGLLSTIDAKSVQFSTLGKMKSIQERAGTLNSVCGSMSVKNAYVRITRNIHHITPNYGRYTGYPYYTYATIGNCMGFTKCKEVFINTDMGTPSETEQIRQLLMAGIII